ncbi:MAG: nucleotide sugar dehydrogenase, partial [Rickettsiales bacterium]|nr:nucleotide sugar dehydrogenase [Rickettsiales bacterium]
MNENKKYDVCMFGLGPVGTISAACFAKQGFNVVGVDVDPRKIDAFKDNKAPFIEPGIDELIAEVQAENRFRATTDAMEAASNARIIMIAVGTPTPADSGKPDLTYLDKVSESIGKAIKGQKKSGVIVVVRSTVPPGTMRRRLAPIIEANSGLTLDEDFYVASNPEFLREGKAIYDFFNTGRVVMGADQPQVNDAIEGLYKDVSGKRIKTSIESAEFAKYVDNTWHALKVGFANEIGRVCKAFGGNIDNTTEIFLSDDKLNLSSYYLTPGFAFGGSCLPKDVRGLRHLADNLDVNIPIVDSILNSNEEQITQGIEAITASNPTKVGLLGVAFKAGVDDLRESPSLEVARQLKNKGINVIAHDPAYESGDALSVSADQKLDMVDIDAITSSC